MKTIVAGSRDFTDYDLMCKILDSHLEITEVVCGMSYGADLLGADWANEHGIPVKCFPADWDKYGPDAGYIRNAEMAKYSNGLIAFWNGRSTGTSDMIKLARLYRIKINVVEI